MSILVRAALLGGLAYVVSRAVRNNDSDALSPFGSRRLSHSDRRQQDEPWPTSEQHSSGNM